MKFPKENIVAIMFAAVAVLVAFQIKSCTDPKQVNETAIRNDEKVKALQREIILKDSLYNVNIAVLDSQNKILSDKITVNKTSVTQSNERIKTIPYRSATMPIDEVISTIEQ